jgi:ligand-binding sensor domain-containing protein/serine phosphatase RsbU (regulator of sigma subunit)
LYGQVHHLPPSQPLSRYVLNRWHKDTGLPTNSLNGLIQSSDGYIWATSYSGIIRFDGSRFTLFDKDNLSLLSTNPTELLFERKDKSLLISTETSGVLQYNHTTFNSFLTHKQLGSLVNAMVENQEGGLWLGTQKNGIFYYKDGVLTKPLDNIKEVNHLNIKALCIDHENKLWIGTDAGLFVWNNNNLKTYNTQKGLWSDNINALMAQEKKVWVGTTRGLHFIENQLVNNITQTATFPVRQIIYNPISRLFWVATQKGLFRIQDNSNKVELFDDNNGLPIADIRNLWIDHEGSLWGVLYRQGLIRFKRSNFENYTEKDGIPAGTANTVCEISPNTYLIGTDVGKIFKLTAGKLQEFFLKTPLITDKRIKRIYKDKKQNIWICSYSGLLKINSSGQETVLGAAQGLKASQIRTVLETSDGTIWVGTREAGVFKMLANQEFVQLTDQEFTSNFIMCMNEDATGNIWIGTNDAGIFIVNKEGKIIKKYDSTDGLLTNLVFNITFDTQNNVWIATNAGIAILDNQSQKIHLITAKNSGLPDEGIFDIALDDSRVWCTSNKGLINVSLNDIEKLIASNFQQKIHYVLYDKQDGMSSSECTGACEMLQDTQGRLFIPTLGGISVLDAKNIAKNTTPPPIQIENILANDSSYVVDNALVLPAGTQRIIISYTGLSLIDPQKNKYKYKLENLDNQWVEDNMGECKAVYTNLSPATYTFRVIGSNNDGVWNEKGKSIKITILPYFYQTWWFRGLTVLLVLALIIFIYYYQLNRVRRRNEELEREVTLRTQEITQQNAEIISKSAELLQRQQEILAQQDMIEEKNAEMEQLLGSITSSIQYAQRIQEAMLPTEEQIQEIFPNTFILYMPRDIVSGDFYWFQQLQTQSQDGQVVLQNKYMIAVADCTGHGVPGAFMSMAGQVFLNQIVNIQGIHKPHRVLSELHKDIRHALKQEFGENRDGMDIALCKVNYDLSTLYFAGAKRPLLYIQPNEEGIATLHHIEGDKMPIGGAWGKDNDIREFTLRTIPIPQKDVTTLYMFSDGYHDQFGGQVNKRFSSKRLRELLFSIHTMGAIAQKEYLKATFENWKGTKAQIDDVLVMSMRI